MTNKTSIIIADDHPIVRSGLRQIIETDERFVVLGEADDGVEAVRMIEYTRPDVAILDVDMPNMDGLQTAREIGRRSLAVKTIFLTIHSEEDLFHSAMDLGAHGYLLKQSAISEIVPAIKAVSEGNFYVTPLLTAFLLKRRSTSRGNSAEPKLLERLTKTELQILKMIANYKSSKAIAEELYIHFRTVQNHRNNIARKLEITGHNALLKYALDHKNEI